VVCGLGASAGGLEALSQFLEGLDGRAEEARSLGVAFVVVQHLHPDHETRMPELLGRHTPLPCVLAEDDVIVEPGTLYVIPPRAVLQLKFGPDGDHDPAEKLRLSVTVDETRARRLGPATTIDTFFDSLAEHLGEHSIGVVLSGLGSDGTLGLRTIKERGGLSLGQEGATAKFSSMPDSANTAGVLDDILPARELGKRILDYARRLGRLKLVAGLPAEAEHAESIEDEDSLTQSTPDDGDTSSLKGRRRPGPVGDEAIDGVLRAVADVVGDVVGYDFAGYKPGTILRRVERRMHVLRLDEPEAYVKLLRRRDEDGESEARALFADLLIGVTQFFRDPASFEALETQAIPKLLTERERGEPLRIWSAGCSTGEEAYSMAMLALEARDRLSRSPRPAIQVFASDLDAGSLAVARAGRYPKSINQHIRPDRFFRRDGDEYVVSQELRDLVLFSRHSLIADPPFGRIDLLACRNLLIYLQPKVQHRLTPLFHYAVRTGGVLFLGSSENPSGRRQDRLFKPIDAKHRIFERLPTTDRETLVMPETPLPRRREAYEAMGGDQSIQPVLEGERVPPALARRLRDGRIDKALLDEYAPPAVAVDQQMSVVYAVGNTGRFLKLPEGRFDGALTGMAPLWMKADLVAAVQASRREGERIERLVVPPRDQTERAGSASIRVVVRPIDGDLTLVSFDDRPASQAEVAEARVVAGEDVSVGDEILRRELVAARDDLSETIEQLELSNEELKSSNEELLSMNEELQSANEELQTSKEEYQSTNEELETVNAEVRRKVEELNDANADLQNLFGSGQVPTVFLDRGLNIKRFTPGAKEVFRLDDDDVGRHIGHVKTRFVDGDLDDICRGVLETLERREIEVRRPSERDGDETFYLMRISPYRTLDDQIEGVVLNFSDVTELKQAIDQKDASERSLKLALRASKLGTWRWDVETERYELDGRSCKILDLSNGAEFQQAMSRIHEDDRDEVENRLRKAIDPHGDGRYEAEFRWQMPDGSLRWIHGMSITTFRRRGERREAVSQIGVIGDVTQRHRIQEELAQSERRLRQSLVEIESIYDNADVGLAVVDRDLVHRRVNKRLADINGVPVEETLGRALPDVIPEIFPAVEPFYRRVLDNGESILNIEVEGETPKQPGVRRAFVVSYLPLRTGDDVDMEEDGNIERISDIAGMGSADASEVTGVNVVVHEITARKKIEEELEAARREAEAARDQAQAVVGDIDRAKQDAIDAAMAKDRFLAALSHELRTPLTPILAAADEPVGDDPAQDYATLSELVRRNVGLEVRLIDDLLDMTRIDRGKLDLQREPIDAAETISRAVEMVRPMGTEKQITIETRLPAGLPAADADPARVMQIVWNLVSNAVKFTDPGGRVDVTLTAVKLSADELPVLRVRVIDTGRGIDPELLPKVFNAFEQGGDGDRTGLGLGLAISQNLVELHGGDITVESGGPGNGATFGFTLPTTTTAANTAAPASADGPAGEQDGSGRTKQLDRIPPTLLVEDHGDTGRVLKRILEKQGARVTLAASITDAKEAFDPQTHRLLISDLGLPDGTGDELLADLRQRAPDLIAIALSGYGADSDRQATRSAGFAEHLVKPVDLNILYGAIRRALA
jgi:two-component system CheB/CheR fusion protein